MVTDSKKVASNSFDIKWIFRVHFQNCLILQKAFLYYSLVNVLCSKFRVLLYPKQQLILNYVNKKTFQPGQIHVASSRIKSLQWLYLTGTFQWNSIKATHEYEVCSTKWGLFIQQEILTILRSTLVFTLLNIRSLRRHIVDIASDLHLIESDM